jgi:hypothetical protein
LARKLLGLAYILSIAERHNALLGIFVKLCVAGAEIAIGQARLGICFSTGRKHVTSTDEMMSAKSGMKACLQGEHELEIQVVMGQE